MLRPLSQQCTPARVWQPCPHTVALKDDLRQAKSLNRLQSVLITEVETRKVVPRKCCHRGEALSKFASLLFWTLLPHLHFSRRPEKNR